MNAEGKPLAGGIRGGSWLTSRRVNVQKRGDSSGSDGGVTDVNDAHVGEGGWFQGRSSRHIFFWQNIGLF